MCIRDRTRIGAQLTRDERDQLLKALQGGDNQKRAVIQAHTRLGLDDIQNKIRTLEKDDNPLVAGAACAYAARRQGRTDVLQPLFTQLQDELAGRRRAAVIDLGDAGQMAALPLIVKAPVSMPLRAKSAFQLVAIERDEIIKMPVETQKLMASLLRDYPDNLNFRKEWAIPLESEQIEKDLFHRDEGRQYRAVQGLLRMQRSLSLIHI